MDYGKCRNAIVAGIATLTIGCQAFGWGSSGHRVVGEVAALIANGSFWSANEASVGKLVNVPDWYWKTLPTHKEEKPTHFFEPDGYFSDPTQFQLFPRAWTDAVKKYGAVVLVDHGTAVWRMQQFANLASKSLAQGDYKKALEMAGAMGHYVGDLSQPLHVTTNFDGQLTGQKGIHMFFETTNLNSASYEALKAEVLERAKILLQDKAYLASFGKSYEEIIFNSVDRSYPGMAKILDIDKKLGRTGEGARQMYELALDRLADGAATLAVVLTKVWKNSPNANYAQSVNIQTPEWVAPKYDSGSRRRQEQRNNIRFFRDLPASDDCSL